MKQNRKVLVGRVVSDKMNKTVIVAVESYRRHPLYKKLVRKTKKYAAHDEENRCRVGDVVRIVETRPLSRTKRWRVVEVLGHEEMAGLTEGAVSTEEAVPEGG